MSCQWSGSATTCLFTKITTRITPLLRWSGGILIPLPARQRANLRKELPDENRYVYLRPPALPIEHAFRDASELGYDGIEIGAVARTRSRRT